MTVACVGVAVLMGKVEFLEGVVEISQIEPAQEVGVLAL